MIIDSMDNMQPIRACVALGLICLCPVLNAQTGAQSPLSTEQEQKIASLKEQLRDTNKLVKSGHFEDVQVALAKLGQHDQLQQILCELKFGRPVIQTGAFDKLKGIGGWFSINALSKFLADSPSNMHARHDFYGLYLPPQILTLQILPHIVPNPPVGEVNATRMGIYKKEREQAVRTWTEWLEKNRDSLRSLQPVGEGVNSSATVCQEVLSKDPANLLHPEQKMRKGVKEE